MKTIAMHRTFEKSEESGLRQTTLYLYDGKETRRLRGKVLDKWQAEAKLKGVTIRSTSLNATDILLKDLIEQGAKIVGAHWHSTGIEKGLGPAEIVEAYLKLPDSLFRPFTPRPDLAKLRTKLALRNALLRLEGDCIRRIKQEARNSGLVSPEDIKGDEEYSRMLSAAREISKTIGGDEEHHGEIIRLDKEVANLAKNIRECQIFQRLANIKDGWIWPASVVAFSGGIERFPDVAAWWHYCGEHVVDGKAPKRAEGKAITWNKNLRTANWQGVDSILKNSNNPWKQRYDRIKEKELARHSERCKCKTPRGHCHARAMRIVRKEILKQFWLAVNKQAYVDHHRPKPRIAA